MSKANLLRTTHDAYCLVNISINRRVGHGCTFATRTRAEAYLSNKDARWHRHDIVVMTVGEALERGISPETLDYTPEK